MRGPCLTALALFVSAGLGMPKTSCGRWRGRGGPTTTTPQSRGRGKRGAVGSTDERRRPSVKTVFVFHTKTKKFELSCMSLRDLQYNDYMGEMKLAWPRIRMTIFLYKPVACTKPCSRGDSMRSVLRLVCPECASRHEPRGDRASHRRRRRRRPR